MGGMDARALSTGRGAVIGTGSPFYDRVPSRNLKVLLAPGGFLAPLLARRERDGIELEPHLRPRNQVHLYCGLTCLVKCRPGRNGKVRFESHHDYAAQECADLLFRQDRARQVRHGAYQRDVWTSDEPGFPDALDRFLGGVEIGARQKKEGSIQARWAQIREPWIVFDREAALGYPSIQERQRFMSKAIYPHVEEARKRLHALARSRQSLPGRRQSWRIPPTSKVRLKLDALAVDAQGNLILLEIKDASGAAAEIYYSPFQLLQNVWEWHQALGSVRQSVQNLLDARVELGLSPGGVARFTGGLRAAIGFGDDERSDEVRRRYSEVLDIVNAPLPPDVSLIETWILKDRQPVRSIR